MKKCTQCRTELEEIRFICEKGISRVTCENCRNRGRKYREKNSEQQKENIRSWKKANTKYVKSSNEFYRNTTLLPRKERALLFNLFKIKQNVFDKDCEKNHYKIDNVLGKKCNVSHCVWKPLKAFQYHDRSWDKLTLTCSSCLQTRRMIRERISTCVNRRLQSFVKNPYMKKKDEFLPFVGCSLEQFKQHIESLFCKEMSWDKYGYYYTDSDGEKQLGFHIDHIIPCSAFDLTNAKELFLCFHWKNCQPLWGNENMGKKNTYMEKEKVLYEDSMKSFPAFASVEKELLLFIEKVKTQVASIETVDTNFDDEDTRQQRALYDDYVFDQALQDVQVMFFFYENPPDKNKVYQETLLFRMKNMQSRKRGENNVRSKKVCQLRLDGTLLNTYASMNLGAKENGTYHSMVSKCCSNPDKLLTGGGFYWCFLDHLEEFQQRIMALG